MNYFRQYIVECADNIKQKLSVGIKLIIGINQIKKTVKIKVEKHTLQADPTLI